MSDSSIPTPAPSAPLAWAERPTVAQRTSAQQAVARLFELLVPQKPPTRRDDPEAATLRHRSPTGCILQGAERAVSVSWFADSVHDLTLGELQLVTWRGQVARPGAARKPGAGEVASPLSQEAFTPVDGGAGRGWIWRDAAGVTYDAAALAARCESLLGDGRAAA
jgi:hypothetical protein